MSINSWEVYFKCPLCGEISTLLQDDIRHYWSSEEKIRNLYKIMNAWKRGFIDPR